MSFGTRLLEAKKRKGISQKDIAERLVTKGHVIGRYERDEMKPSIEVAAKIADILEVSLDWLVGSTDLELDKSALKRVQEVSKLGDEDKKLVYAFVDAYVRDAKNKQAFGLTR